MTREEAIKVLGQMKDGFVAVHNGNPVMWGYSDYGVQAFDMAIEALKREPSDDLIKRSDAIEALDITDWYHQNRNKDMVSGANSDEHQAWYKVGDVYKALEAVPSAYCPNCGADGERG